MTSENIYSAQDEACPYCSHPGPFFEYYNGITLYPELGKRARACYNCRGFWGIVENEENGEVRE